MHPKPNAPHSGRGPRWMRILLVGSLALNLLVAGLFVGAHFSARGGGAGPEAGRAVPIGFYGRALERSDRRALAREFRSQMRGRGHRGMGRSDDYKKVLVILRTTPFSMEALSQAISSQAARGSDAIEIGRAALLSRIGEMSVEERGAYADRLERAIEARRPQQKAKQGSN